MKRQPAALPACAVLLSVALSISCLGMDFEKEEQLESLSTCRVNSSDEEALDTILISQDFGGSVAYTLDSFSLIGPMFLAITIVGALWDAQTPAGWRFEDGTYYYDDEMFMIGIRAYTGVDSAYGPAGTHIVEDALSLDSYFEGAVAVVDESTNEVTINFDGVGPLVELLGVGVSPSSPLTMSLGDTQQALGMLLFEAELVVDQLVGVSRVSYHLVTEPLMPIGEFLGGGFLAFHFVEATATREELGQELTVDDWQIESGQIGIDGHIDITVRGGAFPFRGRLRFNDYLLLHDVDRDLECL